MERTDTGDTWGAYIMGQATGSAVTALAMAPPNALAGVTAAGMTKAAGAAGVAVFGTVGWPLVGIAAIGWGMWRLGKSIARDLDRAA